MLALLAAIALSAAPTSEVKPLTAEAAAAARSIGQVDVSKVGRIAPGAPMSRGFPVSSAQGGNVTAIDHPFGQDAAVGSLGYLCGLRPLPNATSGAASTFGEVGTFLGAKLSLAFK